MKRLILMRHGKAEGQAASGEDFDRALAARGDEDAAAMGRRLAARGCAPDVALVSPALRAKDTWEATRPAFPGARTEYAASLYEAPARAIRDLAQVADADCLMVVGHNPGLQDLAVRLAVEAGAQDAAIVRLRLHFPPATAAVFAFDPAGRPAFEGVLYPEGDG